ncbi:RagB/SusD family nutrient uptake outer membrane protein [uncultured Bacteroides sp.]|uniref:RagB/SusD family nutrient uptake outer membrane protein n=1 Tax=uncultured Bacteroides sp. TaxID=162156 RepID=UPI002AAB01CD|nr:RagB/SusD family nutrient uptake outer membrane protein [uncultured Bacteroides sp.]
MKKYILLSMIVLGSASCSDSFLEEKMVSTITQDYFETEQGLEQLIVGTYDALRVTKQYQQGPYSLEIGLDNITTKYANVGMYSPSEWTSTSKVATNANGLCGEYSKSLLGYYPIINNCNRAIESIRGGKASGKFATSADYAALRLSEALFNRAYCLYIMNTLYGDIYVPLAYTTSLPNNYSYKRETSENIYKLIIGDLRYAYEHLPDVSELNLGAEFGRETKGAAAHFLAKLYLQRYEGSKYGTTEYGRNADGSIDNSNEKSYLGLLYKGNVSTDLDSCVYYATQVIKNTNYELETDYGKLFAHPLGDYSNENSKELILSCVYGQIGSADNGRYGNRMPYFFGGDYVNAAWGIPDFCWEYPTKSAARTAFTNDFGFDLYVNKQADSRYQKSFHLEYTTALRGGSSSSSPSANVDYYAYNASKNVTYTWTEDMANYFNANVLPDYNRESWGGRKAVAGEHKMGKGDIAFAFVENTKETALDIKKVLAQPFVVMARWIKDGNKYYYRVPTKSDGSSYTYNAASYTGLDKLSSTCCPATLKYDDPDRASYKYYESSRDIPIFRLAETYLIRAAAYGYKKDYPSAIADINEVRDRAAFKNGETRDEVLARLQPGYEKLAKNEQQWPYTVIKNMTNEMKVDESYWDGSSEHSRAEQYPATATTTEDRFANFILNELARELNSEMVYYENLHHSGWQADRIIYHNQLASTLTGLWDTSDNLINGIGETGNGMGFFKPCYTFKPFAQTLLDLMTDEKANPLDDAAKKAYQNYGY